MIFQAIDRTLSRPALIARLAVILAILGGAAGLFLYLAGWFTPRTLTPASMINTFEQVNGVHSGFRRNHAKGVCFRGYFESNGEGAALSKAAVFPAGRIPVLGRFSLGGGQPYVTDAPSTVRALAVLFQLPNGEEWRMALINLPVFPVQNVEQFREQMLASAPDPATGKVDPEKMKAFVAAHPATAKALPLILGRPISSGFADSTYFGLNAFRFIDSQGRITSVRWAMVPEQPFLPNTAADPEKADKNYLFDGLIAAARQGPQRWRLIVTVGEPGDPTHDATIPWPDTRRKIDVGVLVVEKIESEADSPARDINFDPTILPSGMALSDDPLLSARAAAYSQSFTRREGEPKEPSAVSTAETEK
jgi:catalase